jgi:hypothetical protein
MVEGHAGTTVVLRVTRHVKQQPVADQVTTFPGVASSHWLECADRYFTPPKTIMLDVVDQLEAGEPRDSESQEKQNP